MAGKRKNLQYTFPGSTGEARQHRMIAWILTLAVGLLVAFGIGVLIYMKDRL